jgi:hypothetical protein
MIMAVFDQSSPFGHSPEGMHVVVLRASLADLRADSWCILFPTPSWALTGCSGSVFVEGRAGLTLIARYGTSWEKQR